MESLHVKLNQLEKYVWTHLSDTQNVTINSLVRAVSQILADEILADDQPSEMCNMIVNRAKTIDRMVRRQSRTTSK